MTSSLQSAKVFLLGQILCITQDNKPVDSSMSSTSVVSYIYQYDSSNEVYTAAGRSTLLKADKVLIVEVTDYIDTGIPDL